MNRIRNAPAPIRPLRMRTVYFNGAQWQESNYYWTADNGHVGIMAIQGNFGISPGDKTWLYKEK